MVYYIIEEEDPWKCKKHSSKQRSSGVCSTCLRDRLIRLCPECAKLRPCSCCHQSSTSSSNSSSNSSSSSSTSTCSFSLDNNIPPKSGGGVGVIGRMSNLIDNEPPFQRSRSAAFSFLSRRRTTMLIDKKELVEEENHRLPPPPPPSSNRFWSVFKKTTKKGDDDDDDEVKEKKKEEEQKKMMMLRSRSVGIPCYSDPVLIPVNDVRLKSSRSWYFPSPIKVFRQHKSTKINQERSPLCRG